MILLTPNERRVAEDRRDCYWLYVVTGCASAPKLQDPIPDPARFDWNEVTKVAHYYLSVNAPDPADAGAGRSGTLRREGQAMKQYNHSPASLRSDR